VKKFRPSILLSVFFLFVLGINTPAHAASQEISVKVKTEVIEGQTIYPSEFFSIQPQWFERIQLGTMTVPDAWSQGQYTFELWNKHNRPIGSADRLRSSKISLETLNQKDITEFRLVLFVPEGSEAPPITDAKPGIITVQYDQSQNLRLLLLTGGMSIGLLALLVASWRRRRTLQLWQSFQQVIRFPLNDLNGESIDPVALLWTIILFSSIFGAVIGTFTGGIQIFFVLVKLPLLLFGTLAVSFFAISILSAMLGVDVPFRRLLQLSLHLLAVISMLLASLSPILAYFVWQNSVHDPFLLLTLFCAGMATLSGWWVFFKSLERSVPSQHAFLLGVIWFGVFAVVGLQVGWLLRPWVGLIDEIGGSVPFVRLYSGNVFEGLFHFAGDINM
jgi:hypothetical protein